MSLFTASEKLRLGCLTDDGLYTLTYSHYPWKILKISALETDVPVPSGGTEHHIILRAFENNFVKRWVLMAYLCLLSLLIFISVALSVYFLRRYGLRDDVLALAFATFFDAFALAVFRNLPAKLDREHKQGWVLPFIINTRHIKIEDLTAFVERHR